MNNNYEMATPINSLGATDSNVNNLVKNVENNIETLNNIQHNPSLTYNPNIEIPQKQQQLPNNVPTYNPTINIQPVEKMVNVKKPVEKKCWYKSLLVNSKEYLIVVLLFSLLAHKKINKILFSVLPCLYKFQTPIPSLIFRGILFSVILFAIKKLI